MCNGLLKSEVLWKPWQNVVTVLCACSGAPYFHINRCTLPDSFRLTQSTRNTSSCRLYHESKVMPLSASHLNSWIGEANDSFDPGSDFSGILHSLIEIAVIFSAIRSDNFTHLCSCSNKGCWCHWICAWCFCFSWMKPFGPGISSINC